MSELEYDRIEVLEEEADWKANKSRQLKVSLEDELIRSLRLGDVSLRIREASVVVTNYWLEDQFQDSLQRDEVVMEGQMERLLAYLVHEDSLKLWLDGSSSVTCTRRI